MTEVKRFERTLLRTGVNALEASRHRCADCGRTPLIGERMHAYGGRKQAIVCELCRARRSEPPAASELVRPGEQGRAVRLTVRSA